MKIRHAAASPFVRKCLVAAHELGLRDRIELVPAAANPVQRDPSVVAQNPLGKIPTLITDDGLTLYDSRVICEYLNACGDGHLLPRADQARWRVLVDQSLADGVMEIGTHVPLDQLQEAMEDWFRRKSYLPKGARLTLEEG